MVLKYTGSTVGEIEVSIDGGETYSLINFNTLRQGIELPKGQNYSLIRIKGKNGILSSLDVITKQFSIMAPEYLENPQISITLTGKTYKYETHLHTNESSVCGVTNAADYIQAYYNLGYSGIFVTDHSWRGNGKSNPQLNSNPSSSWEEILNRQFLGFETAYQAAQEFNIEHNLIGTEDEFKVFPGIEHYFNGDEILTYGITKEMLLESPYVRDLDAENWCAWVRFQGGLTIQAHPFRDRDYINTIHLNHRWVDGIEIFNAGNYSMKENEEAEYFAKIYSFPVQSGSDIHELGKYYNFNQNGNCLSMGGMEFESPLNDGHDYARRIKDKEGKIIRDISPVEYLPNPWSFDHELNQNGRNYYKSQTR